VITQATPIFASGYYKLANDAHKYRNWNRNGSSWVDLDAAIMRSNAFAPAEDPRVMIGNGEARGRVAGSVVREVMDAWHLNRDGHLKGQYAYSASPPSDIHG
jgi:hypothetical protein